MRKILLNILKYILKQLTRLVLWRYQPEIIGITGSVGKTSTKEAVQSVLRLDFQTRSPSKNFNNELGLPLTILGDWKESGGFFFWFKVILVGIKRLIFKSKSYPKILILEYGVDKPGDMKYLLNLAKPKIGIVTAIGEIPVHVEFFMNVESLAREKSKLIYQLPAMGFALLNIDDPLVWEMKEQSRAPVVSFGFSEMADIKISNFENHFEKGIAWVSFKLSYGGSSVPIHLNDTLGRSQAYAAAAAAGVGLILGMNLVKISEALHLYQSPPGRLKVLPGLKGSFIIDDTYNAAPLATMTALQTLKELSAERKIAVLGDMLEIGKYTLEAHESVGRLAAKIVDLLLVVGFKAKLIAEAASEAGLPAKSIFAFTKISEAADFLRQKIKKGDLILIKGSQAVRLEKVVKEIMREPEKAEALLVRQNKRWFQIPGMYDN
ncbi:hypothetical protein COY65_01275 [Candidatus Jorgensenbacteria bacterium CG_4_10_14_0_8_um_filter_39_13]|uniref:UDP-N-acetylmuramoyl-tripeptide--D-alanyl-D-alanine ligase n=2 Tax=Candidatus Joergenseniibacteriota TaxID=1752739 RepID=A0A2M7RI87_9BACT|nr:MAG: hypothetical protein COV54_01660 [Candidatus Jorgensenbacteria bacterium CG11_big_fil_rev_8_21_14_0_20_38_23]PIV12949.1 MAG: hypothetical protein COS46_02820 [Candidatus Jorgensenbacteria bacterium CG03_land_8_20_14_0_80_38_39]PIW97772.1 MAG: hypothetical protein COZ81_00830 [Candidatus Jorgensenbacteria bacterium CG_4_8_14_3_um_filter_38_10]PIY96201.1 MAG: hypothetical protein COY65_01275 [Candidatus Jorgensenbacteria bacterium CG_4_10_14_0_8_um_filter_39_13]PJA95129.1 MAG: hypothetica